MTPWSGSGTRSRPHPQQRRHPHGRARHAHGRGRAQGALRARGDRQGQRTVIALPMTSTGRRIGAIGLSFPGLREDAAELEFFDILADTCAQAMVRIGAEEEARRQSARLLFLADASSEPEQPGLPGHPEERGPARRAQLRGLVRDRPGRRRPPDPAGRRARRPGQDPVRPGDRRAVAQRPRVPDRPMGGDADRGEPADPRGHRGDAARRRHGPRAAPPDPRARPAQRDHRAAGRPGPGPGRADVGVGRVRRPLHRGRPGVRREPRQARGDRHRQRRAPQRDPGRCRSPAARGAPGPAARDPRLGLHEPLQPRGAHGGRRRLLRRDRDRRRPGRPLRRRRHGARGPRRGRHGADAGGGPRVRRGRPDPGQRDGEPRPDVRPVPERPAGPRSSTWSPTRRRRRWS